MIRTAKIEVATTGADGAATGTGYSDAPLNGTLRMIVVDWAATAPGATSDLTVTVEADGNHPAVTLFSKSDSATDVTAYPRVQATDTAGTGIADQYVSLPVAGRIKAAVAQCNALAPAVTVTVYVEE